MKSFWLFCIYFIILVAPKVVLVEAADCSFYENLGERMRCIQAYHITGRYGKRGYNVVPELEINHQQTNAKTINPEEEQLLKEFYLFLKQKNKY